MSEFTERPLEHSVLTGLVDTVDILPHEQQVTVERLARQSSGISRVKHPRLWDKYVGDGVVGESSDPLGNDAALAGTGRGQHEVTTNRRPVGHLGAIDERHGLVGQQNL